MIINPIIGELIFKGNMTRPITKDQGFMYESLNSFVLQICKHMILVQVDAIISFTMKHKCTLLGQFVLCFITPDMAFIVSAVYAMVMHEFGPIFCMSVSITKGIMQIDFTS